jgi:hypothetical protein
MLAVGGGPAFKPFRLAPLASWMTVFLVVLALAAAATGLDALFGMTPASLREAARRLAPLTAVAVAAILVVLAVVQRRTPFVLVTGAIMVTAGWLVARIHLWFFDPIYRFAGRVRPRSGQSGSESR